MKIWILINNEGEVVVPGDPITSFRGEEAYLVGGKPPQHEGSTGRVYTDWGEYFPSVFGLTWRQV